MPAPSWERPEDFLDPLDFAFAGVIQFQAGGTRTVNGLLDENPQESSAADSFLDDVTAYFTALETDLAGTKRGDTITVEGVAYNVLTSPRPDGSGFAKLKMAKE